MILDTLVYAHDYYSIHELFPRAFAFLAETNWKDLPDGKHTIMGDRLFVIVATEVGRGREQSPLEFHRNYTDIQYVIEGHEEIGWLPVGHCAELSSPYDVDRDVGFYSDAPKNWLSLSAGMFCVLTPNDAHAPLAGIHPLRKAVVKVGRST